MLIPPVFRSTPKKSGSQPQIPGLDPSIALSVGNQDITTTTIVNEDSESREFEQKLEACRTAGIYYLPKDATFLCNFSLDEVLKAILYFLFNREGVYKPEGWFKVCLEDNWAGKEEQRHQRRSQWSAEGLFDAIRHCKAMMEAI